MRRKRNVKVNEPGSVSVYDFYLVLWPIHQSVGVPGNFAFRAFPPSQEVGFKYCIARIDRQKVRRRSHENPLNPFLMNALFSGSLPAAFASVRSRRLALYGLIDEDP